MAIQTNVRFFTYDEEENGIVEIAEPDFRELAERGHKVSYERHTMFADGVDQICLTVESFYETLFKKL